MQKKMLKILLLIFIIGVIASFFAFDLQQYASLAYLKEQKDIIVTYYNSHRFLVVFLFSLAYILVTAFSLPFATILTLLAGALFGLFIGIVIVSFASSLGATAAFLMSRFLFKNAVQEKYGKYLTKINAGFAREGSFYLFALRLTPAIPFFLVNILMALLPIKAWTFYWVSQLGMLIGTALYVYAGTELSKISNIKDIASPQLLIALTFLGFFPVIAKRIINIIRVRRRYGKV